MVPLLLCIGSLEAVLASSGAMAQDGLRRRAGGMWEPSAPSGFSFPPALPIRAVPRDALRPRSRLARAAAGVLPIGGSPPRQFFASCTKQHRAR
jgi:hypothetical protein